MLDARSITFQIQGSPILNDVSLSVKPGEFVAVVGANGAGKSTLLRVLCGDIQPQRGNVYLNDKPLHDWNVKERAKNRAVLPQSSSLTFAFTAREVVLMGRTPHIKGVESARDYAIADEALGATGVAHLANRQYTTLSGGESQRVQMARVLAQIWESVNGSPRYLLLDEPTNNLDLAHQHDTLDIARSFAREGVGVLAILHDLNLAAQYADRIVILHRGCCLAEGTPEAVLTPALIQQAFGIPVIVSPHPCYNCPLVISLQRSQAS